MWSTSVATVVHTEAVRISQTPAARANACERAVRHFEALTCAWNRLTIGDLRPTLR